MYRCPKCKCNEEIGISGLIYVSALLDKNGDVIPSSIQQDIGAADLEWYSDSMMYCNACDHDGVVSDFESIP